MIIIYNKVHLFYGGFMKKVKGLIAIALLCSITSCGSNEVEAKSSSLPTDLNGKETFENYAYDNVELFDSFDIQSYDEYNFQCKTKKKIFDLDKIYSSDIEIHEENPRNSSVGCTSGLNYKSISGCTKTLNKYVVTGDIEFDKYLNDEFISNIVKLNNDEVDAAYIYDIYGTNFASRCTSIRGYDIKATIELLHNGYSEYKSDFLNYLFKKKESISSEEKSLYEQMYNCVNVKYETRGHFTINSREELESFLNDNTISEFSFVKSYCPIYKVVSDEYTNAKEKLTSLYYNIMEQYYNSLKK